MCAAFSDPGFFLPAATQDEAIARIYSLTGDRSAGTRGEKRAILALRDALGLDVDTGETSDVMAAIIAMELNVEWRPDRFTTRHRINLDGLNALLQGAAVAYAEGSLRHLERMRPSLLDGPEWAKFVPARSKIEAVNRISALTNSGPEWLGPGSKEHKRVLVNLVNGMGLDVPITTKHSTAEALARAFNAPWSDICISTQGTITLDGLNVLLAGAERRLGRLGVDRALLLGTPEEEGEALAAALVDAWRAERQSDGGTRVVWDARKCIEWMLDQGLTDGPNHNEWQGFYWEARGRAVLNSSFAPNPQPPRTRYGNTSFDYSLKYVWDLKAHTEHWLIPSSGAFQKGRSQAPLNDQESMRACIEDQGLGFLMVSGVAVLDEDLQFVEWHRKFKARQGVRSRPSNSGRSRRRKAAFEPLHVEAFYFDSLDALRAARAAGQVTGFSQGKQAPGQASRTGRSRRPKYNLNVTAARRSSLEVAHLAWSRR